MEQKPKSKTLTANPAYFTGAVTQEPIIQAPAPSTYSALRVTFQPGGRTNWHTHPYGQTLYVLNGLGRFQTEGEAPVDIKPGETIWIPPNEKHWHGAHPEHAMTHIAIQQKNENGDHIVWMEPVSEEDYNAPST
ncbi:cupin domain-containing protein [Rhodobacteraceae bacterium NNCM2]|nr:cupin domain-containing protein [Coraliihabitans acroporae]